MEKMYRRLYSKYKAQAKHRNLEFELEYKEFKDLVSKNCDWCDSKPSNKLKYSGEILEYNGLDRLDNSIGYKIDNVVSCCAFCNSLRSSMPLPTWIGFLKGVTRRSLDSAWWLREEGDDDRARKKYYRYGKKKRRK